MSNGRAGGIRSAGLLANDVAQSRGSLPGHWSNTTPGRSPRVMVQRILDYGPTRSLQILLIALFLGLVFWFYLWTARSSGNPTTRFYPRDYYNLLSDAFLSGKLSLLVEPRKELLALPNPYDPYMNHDLKLHDASLYKGRYYLYWGPVPALVLFIPFRLTLNRDLPGNVAVALFCFAGVLWSVFLLNVLIRTYFPKTPFWMHCAAVCCVSFSNVAPFILRRPAVYEVAISSGYCFLLGSLYWLVSGGLVGKGRPWRLALGSLFLGLAVGSRPHLVFAGIFLPLLWVKLLKAQYGTRVRDALKELLCLLVPFLLCLALLGLYNYARFGSWTDFGTRYNLIGYKQSGISTSRVDRILPNLFFYFLAPSHVSLQFPFFHLEPSYPWPVPQGRRGPDRVAGILANIPFLNILFLSPLYLFWRSRASRPYLGWLMGCCILLALALATFVSNVQATMRYVVDFASLLLIPAIMVWCYFDEQLQDHKIAKFLFGFISALLIVYGSLFNVAISMTGYEDLLKARNPETYEAIRKLFVPLQQLVARYSYTPFGALDAPAPGAVVSGVVPVLGWALDRQTSSDRLTLTLLVDGKAVEAPLRRFSRPEVCYSYRDSGYPGACGASSVWFDWNTRGLRGPHTVAIRVTDGDGRSAVLGPHTVTAPVTDTPPFGFLDAPAPGATVSATVPVLGWALDLETPSTSLSLTLLVDGKAVDAPMSHFARHDVCAGYRTYPEACSSGVRFDWNTRGLRGPHTVAIRVTDGDGRSAVLGPQPVTVPATDTPPFGALDLPAAGATVSGTVPVLGWALDRETPSTSLTLTLLVDGKVVDAPMRRRRRRDVCAGHPERTYPRACSSGIRFDWNTRGLKGAHQVAIAVTDEAGGRTLLGPYAVTVTEQ